MKSESVLNDEFSFLKERKWKGFVRTRNTEYFKNKPPDEELSYNPADNTITANLSDFKCNFENLHT